MSLHVETVRIPSVAPSAEFALHWTRIVPDRQIVFHLGNFDGQIILNSVKGWQLYTIEMISKMKDFQLTAFLTPFLEHFKIDIGGNAIDAVEMHPDARKAGEKIFRSIPNSTIAHLHQSKMTFTGKTTIIFV